MSASSATGPIMARPKVKLPCRFAHSVINGSSIQFGGRFSVRDSTMLPHQATMIGIASTCGLASSDGAARIAARKTPVVAAGAESNRYSCRASKTNDNPTHAAASVITPCHAAALKASASSTSASHSWGTHGRPITV